MRIGVDLGGTKIEIALLEADGTISLRRREWAPSGDYQATVRAIAKLVEGVESERGIFASVGVGIPGSISPSTGLVQNANSTWLIGKPFDIDLGKALRRTVRVANDANCFALSEAVDGAGSGYDSVFGVILGTGAGSGIVFGRKVHVGRHAIAGEWGHNPLPWPNDNERPGFECYCGRRGCIETFISGPGIARDHGGSDAASIAAAARAGDPRAVATMERYFDRAARSLAHVINLIDPDAIVLGGGLSNIDALYTELPRRLPAYIFSGADSPPILKNQHGDSSGVRGAAWLWPDQSSPSSVSSAP